MKTRFVFAALAAMLVATPALSQTYRSDYRQHRQLERIDRGVYTGRLTPREARRLYRQQARIDRTEDRIRARNGGYLPPRAQRRLEDRQDRASRNIYRKGHNRRGW